MDVPSHPFFTRKVCRAFDEMFEESTKALR